MTYNEYLKAVRDEYLSDTGPFGACWCLCWASNKARSANPGSTAHYHRLDRAICKELRDTALLTFRWEADGRYGIRPPNGRKDTNRKMHSRYRAARLQWLSIQAE